MKKKNILFVMDGLVMGGVSKVLSNLLSKIDYSNYEIDLLVLHYHGDMKNLIPKDVNIIKGTKTFDVVDSSFKQLIKNKMYLKALKKIYFSFLIKTGLIKYKIIKERKKTLFRKYDNEISYNDGFCTLFCAFGDSANKINWNHVDVTTINSSSKYLRTMKKALSLINTNVSVSKEAAIAFRKYYNLDNEPKVILNIINESEIILKSKETIPDEDFDNDVINIISVGRLDYQKGYDRYVPIHKKLIDDGFKFKVYIIGDGIDKEMLLNEISKNHVENSLILLGKRNNPYPYFLKGDFTLLVSRYEGRPTVISESLVLGKPVFTTEVAGTKYLLDDGKYGIIVNNDEESIYQGLKKVLTEKDKMKKFEKNLENYSCKNDVKMNEFYSLIK